jgi:uncharacterized membrane protein
MTLAPLLAGGPTVTLHALAALAAFVLGGVQLVLPKGTARHRLMGRAWVVLTGAVAGSSLAIHTIRQFGPFSVIHLLSLLTLAALPIGVRAARRGDIGRHRRVMTGLVCGALLIAGFFSLAPGRIMHAVVFGP